MKDLIRRLLTSVGIIVAAGALLAACSSPAAADPFDDGVGSTPPTPPEAPAEEVPPAKLPFLWRILVAWKDGTYVRYEVAASHLADCTSGAEAVASVLNLAQVRQIYLLASCKPGKEA